MGLVLDAVMEILRRPSSVWGILPELVLLCSPLWIAVLVGLVVGWAWRPKWAVELVGGDSPGAERGGAPSPPKPSVRGSLWTQLPSFVKSGWTSEEGSRKEEEEEMAGAGSRVLGSENLAVTEEDLEHLVQLVESRDGGPEWIHMMERSLPTMGYKAWRRDLETGLPQYRSRSVFDDSTPEIVRDFFWDDEFRSKNKWDDMLMYHAKLEECSTTGTMVVHWVRKFPFFCSDREYIIGRRIWQLGRTYYCVTKGVPCSTITRRKKPRRVDTYYSSWCIRPVESRSGDGQLTACEVLLFHHEDMGIPWEIAKLGVRHGMWGMVKKIEPGLRDYQIARTSNEPLSPSASMAQINTKIDAEYLRSLEASTASSEIQEAEKQQALGSKVRRYLLVGGAVALACSLDRGLLTKAIVFGVARRFAISGRRR